MAKTVYVDGTYGDNSNTGLSWAQAKKTIVGARAATASGDLCLIKGGVYKEAKQTFNSVNDTDVLYMPDPSSATSVIVDFENSADVNPAAGFGWDTTSHWFIERGTKFLNISFRNPYTAGNTVFICFVPTVTIPVYLLHCIFYQKSGAANTGSGMGPFNGNYDCVTRNCSFHNLANGLYRPAGTHRNNYYVNVTTPHNSLVGASVDYNAYPGNAEANGINTSTGANPGFRDPGADDFRLDPVTTPADYATFMSGGEYNDRIGALGRGGLYYNSAYPQLRFITRDPSTANGNPQPAWENEGPSGTNTYTDGTPGDIIENAVTYELEIDLATTPGATGGRVRSEVMDLGSVSPNLDELALGASEDISGGAAIDIDTTLPQYIEYRSSNTAFAKGDVSPSWVPASRFGAYVNQGHRYFQKRVTFRTDHTNV